MDPLPITKNALLVRTDFADNEAWERLMEQVNDPIDPFFFTMEVLEDAERNGASVDDLVAAAPNGYPHGFLVVADAIAMSKPRFPLLVVDLAENRGAQFRAAAKHVAEIENNLAIGNMDFEEFAEAVRKDGVFRGF